ncbi:Hypothetical predicted protein [Octopus vulgaris]|uniref:Uncharacterized protein n=1 Tax=Octopus vulgaris TaxID=6645 RepID=A0AA36AP44_OCTVU|nr:Hypothetical predicted protein [Octopus vulgaris]
MPRNYKKKTTRGDTPPDVMERAVRKVVNEKKSLRDVAVKQRIADEINERKSKPKKATGTENATKEKGKSTKTGFSSKSPERQIILSHPSSSYIVRSYQSHPTLGKLLCIFRIQRKKLP